MSHLIPCCGHAVSRTSKEFHEITQQFAQGKATTSLLKCFIGAGFMRHIMRRKILQEGKSV